MGDEGIQRCIDHTGTAGNDDRRFGQVSKVCQYSIADQARSAIPAGSIFGFTDDWNKMKVIVVLHPALAEVREIEICIGQYTPVEINRLDQTGGCQVLNDALHLGYACAGSDQYQGVIRRL